MILRFTKSLFTKLMHFWDWAITPSAPVSQSDLLRQSRLLSGMLLMLVGLGILIESFSFQYLYYDGLIAHIIALLALLVMFLAYLINRRGQTKLAVWTVVAVISLVIFLLTFFTDGLKIDMDFLNYLFIPILFASAFLSEALILILGGTYVFIIVMIPMIFPVVSLVDAVGGPVSFVFTCTSMIFLIFRFRNVIESDRRRELAEKEERYRTLLETSYEGVCIIAGDKIVDANPNVARMFGYEIGELIGQPVSSFAPPVALPNSSPAPNRPYGHPEHFSVYKKDGTPFYIETLTREQNYRGQPAQVIAIRDITERVAAEQALDQSERLYRTLFQGANDAIFLMTVPGKYVAANDQAVKMLGYSLPELMNKTVSDIVAPAEYPDSVRVRGDLVDGTVLPLYERTFRKKDGTSFPVEINATLVRDGDGKPLYIQSVVRDITNRKRTENRMQQQLERLNALREIDRMISASQDLQVTLGGLLEHVILLLGCDAADILLLDPAANRLVYSTGKGFDPARNRVDLAPGEDKFADLAVAERHLASVQDIAAAAGTCLRLQNLAEQGFEDGFAAPLLAKGKVKGVLEIFNRRPFLPFPDWTALLEAFSSQAAIAIENADLFANLQRSNLDLVQAYDETLGGWAKALELRDEETKDHSKRVTEKTMQLGRAFGMDEAALVQLRRGALLHDIGKMAIPDSILLKRGPLTSDEWDIMKQHPGFAVEMLSSIPFLYPALDIPHFHHERWDGTGYPEGLKGEQIPLAARIFAVVDVWDALTSDRPYRKRWATEDVLSYIRAQSGSMFDPQVVKAFLDLINAM